MQGLKFRDSDYAARAAQLRQKLKAAGLTIAEFRRRAGLSRNVAYALSKGRIPTADEQQRIDRVIQA
jgi:hypothetical protein